MYFHGRVDVGLGYVHMKKKFVLLTALCLVVAGTALSPAAQAQPPRVKQCTRQTLLVGAGCAVTQVCPTVAEDQSVDSCSVFGRVIVRANVIGVLLNGDVTTYAPHAGAANACSEAVGSSCSVRTKAINVAPGNRATAQCHGDRGLSLAVVNMQLLCREVLTPVLAG
jgi:hypothetical protein